jgi:hypothetical protein
MAVDRHVAFERACDIVREYKLPYADIRPLIVMFLSLHEWSERDSSVGGEVVYYFAANGKKIPIKVE